MKTSLFKVSFTQSKSVTIHQEFRAQLDTDEILPIGKALLKSFKLRHSLPVFNKLSSVETDTTIVLTVSNDSSMVIFADTAAEAMGIMKARFAGTEHRFEILGAEYCGK